MNNDQLRTSKYVQGSNRSPIQRHGSLWRNIEIGGKSKWPSYNRTFLSTDCYGRRVRVALYRSSAVIITQFKVVTWNFHVCTKKKPQKMSLRMHNFSIIFEYQLEHSPLEPISSVLSATQLFKKCAFVK